LNSVEMFSNVYIALSCLIDAWINRDFCNSVQIINSQARALNQSSRYAAI